MKLEYLDDISGGGKYPGADPGKLVRLYDFEVSELMSLKKEIKAKLIDADEQLVISGLSFVSPLNCSLTFQISESDVGIMPPEVDYNFVAWFSKDTYRNILLIIDSVIQEDGTVSGYNWFYDPGEGQIDLLLSSGVGSW